MKVAITGSSGLIGSALKGSLTAAGHQVLPVVRAASGDTAGPDEIGWDIAAGTIEADKLRGVDAVVHLAGAGIGDERWTPERKREILESRTRSTALLARTLSDLAAEDNAAENNPAGPRTGPPTTLLSGSAIGYYGNRGDEVLTEHSAPGDGFLAEVCIAWEAAAQPAIDAGVRTAFLRTGIVQSEDGGALAKSLPPFKLGIGGRFGDGKQWWSWVSIDDHIGAIRHLLDSDISGPVNLTAPNPVTNAEYTKALGRELGRPTLFPIPKFGPKLLLGGELTDVLLYESQRVEPTVLVDTGYRFRHKTIEECLAAVLGDAEIT